MSTQKPSKKSGNRRCSGGPPAEWFLKVIFLLCLPDTAVRAESAKKTPPFGWCFWSGRRGSNSLPGIPRMAVAIRRSPASPQIKRASHRSRQRLPACPLSHSKRENPILTDGIFSFGAGDEARTRYLDLGKVALYQMSYARRRHHYCSAYGASGRGRTGDTRIFSPLLYQLSYRGIWRPRRGSNPRPPA